MCCFLQRGERMNCNSYRKVTVTDRGTGYCKHGSEMKYCRDTKNQRIKDTIHKAHTLNEHTLKLLNDRKPRGKVQLQNHKPPGLPDVLDTDNV
jgi:hypothetical protein